MVVRLCCQAHCISSSCHDLASPCQTPYVRIEKRIEVTSFTSDAVHLTLRLSVLLHVNS